MEKERSCDLAPKSSLEDEALSNHSSAEEQHKCVQCGNLFVQARNLRSHMLAESGGQGHRCEECNKEVKRNSETHSVIHSGEKNHNCAQSNKSFSVASSLKTHLLIHTGEKKHKCTQCNYSATEAVTLRRQIMSQHSGANPQ